MSEKMKSYIKTGAVVAATIIVIAMFQRHVASVPVVGGYLPK